MVQMDYSPKEDSFNRLFLHLMGTMKILVFVAVGVLFCNGLEIPRIDNHKNAGLLPHVCGKSSLDRVFPSYESNRTTALEFPWTALISTKKTGSDDYEFTCSGTIISARYILTAAHCFAGKERGRTLGRVRVGTRRTIDHECDNTKSGASCSPKVQNIGIARVISHSGFIGKITDSVQEVRDDIALIRLKEPIDLDTEFSRPVCLPKEYHWLNGGVGYHRLSWGLGKLGQRGELLLSDSKSSDKYLKFEESKTPNENCQKKILKGNKDADMRRLFCTSSGKGGADGCHRNSGDPNLERRSEHGIVNYVQHGILIGAAPCQGEDDYGMYTSVDFYMKWILDNLKP